MKDLFSGKRIVVTGGTGSLGQAIVRRLLSGRHGRPSVVIVFSRDEHKQHEMRLALASLGEATEELIYHDFEQLLRFRIGDVRDMHSLATVLRDVDVVFHAAALKQVPSSEYNPYEALMTNTVGANNIVRAISLFDLPVETVVGISTDKACKPVSVMGMTKALQERIFVAGNLQCPKTRFVCVRYGNVLSSSSSVIPLFRHQISKGGPVTVTTPHMTRFLLSLDDAVNAICSTYLKAEPGEIQVPIIPSSKIMTVAQALIGNRDIDLEIVGIRPGEKIHEILVAEDETHRTGRRGDHYVIGPILPEIGWSAPSVPALDCEYSSRHSVMDLESTRTLLSQTGLMDSKG